VAHFVESNHMSYMRGSVKSVTFEIEYPNGFKKSLTLSSSNDLKAILLSDELMNEHMKNMFNVSEDDWQKNPAMVIVDGSGTRSTCEFPQCQLA